jgi:hypothetical protein
MIYGCDPPKRGHENQSDGEEGSLHEKK